jgi:hypothetical protein
VGKPLAAVSGTAKSRSSVRRAVPCGCRSRSPGRVPCSLASRSCSPGILSRRTIAQIAIPSDWCSLRISANSPLSAPPDHQGRTDIQPEPEDQYSGGTESGCCTRSIRRSSAVVLITSWSAVEATDSACCWSSVRKVASRSAARSRTRTVPSSPAEMMTGRPCRAPAAAASTSRRGGRRTAPRLGWWRGEVLAGSLAADRPRRRDGTRAGG